MTLPSASILGVGAITPLGRNLVAIAGHINQPVADVDAFRVDQELLSDPAIAKRLRRADRFIRMATLAAIDAWNAAGGDTPKDRVGLILATGFGPHVRGFKFLDGLLDAGDLAALPTDFSHSVHNAAAAYIAEVLELRGPTLTVTDFQVGFEQAVLLGQTWLAEGVCDRVLVGAAEEIGDVLLHCAANMVDDLVPGEGAVFFVLGNDGPDDSPQLSATETPAKVDLLLHDDPEAESPIAAWRRAGFFPHFGNMASEVAFQLLAAWCAMTLWHDPVDNAATFRRISDHRDALLSITRRES